MLPSRTPKRTLSRSKRGEIIFMRIEAFETLGL
jgi:hypothetical protein